MAKIQVSQAPSPQGRFLSLLKRDLAALDFVGMGLFAAEGFFLQQDAQGAYVEKLLRNVLALLPEPA